MSCTHIVTLLPPLSSPSPRPRPRPRCPSIVSSATQLSVPIDATTAEGSGGRRGNGDGEIMGSGDDDMVRDDDVITVRQLYRT